MILTRKGDLVVDKEPVLLLVPILFSLYPWQYCHSPCANYENGVAGGEGVRFIDPLNPSLALGGSGRSVSRSDFFTSIE